MLCITDRIMGAKICSEFLGELQVIIHPQWVELGISQQELRLKPIECHALEVGLGVDDLCMVIGKGLRVVLEVQLALHNIQSLWGSEPLNWSGSQIFVLC